MWRLQAKAGNGQVRAHTACSAKVTYHLSQQNFTIGEHRLRPPTSAKRTRLADVTGGGDIEIGGGKGSRGGAGGNYYSEPGPSPDAPVTSVAISPCG